MEKEHNYINDISEIRSMMERSSKFMSLSGIAGILAGVYSLVGAALVYFVFDFQPSGVFSKLPLTSNTELQSAIAVAIGIMLVSAVSVIFLFYRKSRKRNENFWAPSTRTYLGNLAVPLCVGGILILILLSQGLVGLLAPLTLIFYGLAQFSASKFTYKEMKSMGLIQMALGLLGSYCIEYSLLLWALGFGLVHIVYGIYVHYIYER